MKTAISIPDSVFQAADKLAARLSISRSALYTAAIAEYIARRTGEEITARLDRVYGAAERKGVPALPAERPPLSRADHW
jgi:predicted transcriptional regulator